MRIGYGRRPDPEKTGRPAGRADNRARISEVMADLDACYAVSRKIIEELETSGILQQLFERVVLAFGDLSQVKGKRILDIACGSNTSRMPAFMFMATPLGERKIRIPARQGYTAQFEPWLCRILSSLGAEPVGVDIGDLSGEVFEHYNVDLGKAGALDFLPDASFDAVQDSRLFGSPEFTERYPDGADRLRIAREIRSQERRLLKPGGILIHSDAENLLDG